MTKLGPQNVDKSGQDRGLDAHESSRCLARSSMASSRRLSCGGRDFGVNTLEFVTGILGEYIDCTH